MTLDPGNFLLLDEPTNHLDLPTREALEDALAGFAGTLLFVSHDRYFINKVATRVAAFDDGRLLLHDGGYDDYLAVARGNAPVDRAGSGGAVPRPRASLAGKGSTARVPVAAPPPAAPGPGSHRGPAAGPPGREQRRADAETRNRRSRELRSFRERIAGLESEILPLETRLKELETAMSSAETYKEPGMARKLGEERKTVEVELAHLYDDWDEATSELQRAEAQLSR